MIQQYKLLARKASSISQYDFLDIEHLVSYVKKKGLPSVNKKMIKDAFNLKLLLADRIIFLEQHNIEGIEYCESQNNVCYYLDNRRPKSKYDGWGNSLGSADIIPNEFKSEFHPFRFYVLFRLVCWLDFIRLNPFQYVQNSNSIKDYAKEKIEYLDKSTSGDNFVNMIIRWNDIVGLSVAVEPWASYFMFDYIKLTFPFDLKDHHERVQYYWKDLSNLLRSIGLENLKTYHEELCQASQILDPNKTIHALLSLMKTRKMQEIDGMLGGALLLKTMAKMIRIATEKEFSIELPEEDEIGYGQWMPGARKRLYGSNRIEDKYENVKEFLRALGLDYGIKTRCYVEGETEYAFFTQVTQDYSHVEIINLKGQFVESKSKNLSFSESLRRDKNTSVFSIILLDGDKGENLRVVKQAAKQDEIVGCFLVSTPDFEFANFTKNELIEIINNLEYAKVLSENQKASINNIMNSSESFAQFHVGMKKDYAELHRDIKGKKWGKVLAQYFMSHRGKEKVTPSGRGEIPIEEALRYVKNTKAANYLNTLEEYKTDPQTGRLILRKQQGNKNDQ